MSDFLEPNRGIEIWLKDGSIDAIDPVFEFETTDDEIIVHNGAYEYRYGKNDIEEWRFYDMEEGES